MDIASFFMCGRSINFRASASHPRRIIIQSVTLKGRAYRPSDWAERLCGVMFAFVGDRQMRYSLDVGQVRLDGARYIVVAPSLIDGEPRVSRFPLDSVKDNERVVIDPAIRLSADYCAIP